MGLRVVDVYSLVQNINNFVKKNKEIEIHFGPNHEYMFKNSNNFVKNIYKNIFQQISNFEYSYSDLKFYILYKYAIDGNFQISKDIIPEKIIKMKSILSIKNLEKDVKLLDKIRKESKLFKRLEDLYVLNEEGINMIYVLIKKGHVSPRFYFHTNDKVSFDFEVADDKYIMFNRIMNKMYNEIEKRNYGNEKV